MTIEEELKARLQAAQNEHDALATKLADNPDYVRYMDLAKQVSELSIALCKLGHSCQLDQFTYGFGRRDKIGQ